MPTQTMGALAGIKVIDLSRVLAGPAATQILGDHGAEVIKIEPPVGDETREWGPPFRATPDASGGRGPSGYYLGLNRNKRGLALDLTKPEARAVVLRLIEDADVVVENFKIGTMERWGLGYHEVLAKRFPKLVYCRISGFGADGPLGGMPGYDAVVQTMTGLSSVTGSEASGPVKMGVPAVDLATSLNAAIGILLALYERARSGRGQFVEAALYDTGIALLHPHNVNFLMGGKLPPLVGNAHVSLAPYDLFPTRTRPVFLGIGNNGQFRHALKVLGAPELADDARFKTVADRNANRPALTELLTKLTLQHDGVDLARTMLDAGVPAGTLNNVAEALTDPHTAARGMVVARGDYKGVAAPVKLERTPASVRSTPPDFNEHGEAILREVGYDAAEIATLAAAGAFVRARPPVKT